MCEPWIDSSVGKWELFPVVETEDVPVSVAGASSMPLMDLLQLKRRRLGRAATEGCPLLSAAIKKIKKVKTYGST